MRKTNKQIFSFSKKTLFIGIALILAWGFLYAVRNGSSQSSEDLDNDGIPDAIELVNLRDVSVNVTSDEVLITISCDDEFRAGIQLMNEGFNLSLQYARNRSNIGNNENWDFNSWFSIHNLIEYVDMNSNDVYDEIEDDLKQIIPISNFEVPHVSTSSESNTATTIAIETQDGMLDFLLSMGTDFILIDGEVIPVNRLHLSLELSSFPFTNASAQVALQIQVPRELSSTFQSETEDEAEGFRSGEEGLAFGNGTYRGIFSWKPELIRDSIPTTVSTGILEDSAILDDYAWHVGLGRGSIYQWESLIGIENTYYPVSSPNTGIFSNFDVPSTVIGAVGGILLGIGGIGLFRGAHQPGGSSTGATRRRGAHQPGGSSTGATRRRGEQVKPDTSGSTKAQDYNSSRSNTTTSVGPEGDSSGKGGKADAKDYNSSRSNTSSGIQGEGSGGASGSGGTKAQDYNSSRSNTTTSAGPEGDTSGGGKGEKADAKDYNSSRSNTSSGIQGEGSGGASGSGGTKAQDYNSSRSNTTTSAGPEGDVGEGGKGDLERDLENLKLELKKKKIMKENLSETTKAQDYNSSRSNTTT